MADTMDVAWLNTIFDVLNVGNEVAPRGKKVLELDHHTIEIDMTHCVLRVKERKVNYALMASEALWILEGRNDIFSEKMRPFSDDGVTLSGAYGPRISSQLRYVVDKLVEDPDTRQATLTIWTPNPYPTKDYPCTVAMDFKLRRNKLNCHVFMRSSDIWLGLPYDVFSFTSVAIEVLNRYNSRFIEGDAGLGTLYVTAASSHLYEEHWKIPTMLSQPPGRPLQILNPWTTTLRHLERTKPGDPGRWWEA